MGGSSDRGGRLKPADKRLMGKPLTFGALVSLRILCGGPENDRNLSVVSLFSSVSGIRLSWFDWTTTATFAWIFSVQKANVNVWCYTFPTPRELLPSKAGFRDSRFCDADSRSARAKIGRDFSFCFFSDTVAKSLSGEVIVLHVCEAGAVFTRAVIARYFLMVGVSGSTNL